MYIYICTDRYTITYQHTCYIPIICSAAGIGGLQGVVLYALPELDGAIDAVPLGGLSAGGDIDARRSNAFHEGSGEGPEKWPAK